MWDERFGTKEYLFGTEPAAFLRDNVGLVPPGARTLCIAEGEGRNAVFLAGLGCQVTAFDASAVGLDKARNLAGARGVQLALHHATIEDWDWSQPFDLVVGVFIQFVGPEGRTALFDGIRRALAPGGRLMLHGYTPEQVALGTGGPGRRENMYTEDMLRDSFADLQVLRLASYEKVLREGTGHSGRSALIDFIADAPA